MSSTLHSLRMYLKIRANPYLKIGGNEVFTRCWMVDTERVLRRMSDRRRQTLLLTAQGFSAVEISKMLRVSPRTVFRNRGGD